MNIDVVNAASNVVMALIWLVYLQFFYRSYKRANRPLMIIHYAQGRGMDAPCMFVNMSKEPVHVQCIVVHIKGRTGVEIRYITDYFRRSPENGDVVHSLREGPIQPGGYIMLGTFNDILSDEADSIDPSSSGKHLKEYEQFQICIAVTHGPSEHHIGVRRAFMLRHEGRQQPELKAYSIYTEQLLSFRKRRIVRRWVEDSLNPHHEGVPQSRQTSQNMA